MRIAGSLFGRCAALVVTSLTPARLSAANDSVELAAAIEPLEQGVPEISIIRLRELLQRDLPEAAKRRAVTVLAEACIRANRPAEALQLLERSNVAADPAARFPRAQALAALQRWPEALVQYEEIAKEERSPIRADAILGAAEAFRATGRDAEAVQALAPLISDPRWGVRARLRTVESLLSKHDIAGAARVLEETKAQSRSEKNEKRFLRGRIEAAQSHLERAGEIFQSVLKNPEGLTHPTLVATLFALADAHLQSRTPEAADDALEDFLEHHPSDAALPAVFAKLDELYRAERKASRNELSRWSRDPAQPRQALALWYLAQAELRGGRRDRAVEFFARLRSSRPNIPELAEALLQFAQLQMEDQQFDEALETLASARAIAVDPASIAKVEILTGQAHYQEERFDAAAASFQQVAHSSSPLASIALFNGALCSLRMGDRARFLIDAAELNSRPGEAQSGGDLLLEQALVQASQDEKAGQEALQKFLRDFPAHPRVSEAWVALAELAFHAAPPRLPEAKQHLARALQAQPTPTAIERADYLNIWIDDSSASPDVPKLLLFANQFLEKHPASPFTGDVRMKLAEAYFRRQDFPNAQTQFQLLAQQNPDSPLAEKALFFAAESAMSSMAPQSLDRAIVLLDEVVRKNGDLKWTARNEQAAIERKLGKNQDALVLYDEVLKNDARPADKREALCAKGDIYSETGLTDPGNYKRAVEVFDQLASDRETPPHWRNQALFKRGICLEKLGDGDGALASYYQTLEQGTRPDVQREFFWFYKAGFSAARLLEEKENWRSAVAVYEKIASIAGNRSEEAKVRLTRLRLEHFLWED